MDVFIHPRFDGAFARHPVVLVDVGARGGVKAQWVPAERHLHVLGFEPDVREYDRLAREHAANPNLTFFNTALHNRRESLGLRITRNPALTSIFDPNRDLLDAFPEPDRFDVLSVEQIQACGLDELLAAERITDVDFLKVDTQGGELFVIEGAASILASSAVGVELEAEFAPLYRGQPLFADVDATLRRLGFSLFDLRPCYWKRRRGVDLGGPRGQLMWADALYLKDIASLKQNLERLDPENRRAKVLRAIAVSLVYGYCDYALEIAAETEAVFDPDDRLVIADSLRAIGRNERGRTNFPGRKLLASIFHRLWRLTVPDAEGWSLGGARLGNEIRHGKPRR